jgi:hypothetical protein
MVLEGVNFDPPCGRGKTVALAQSCLVLRLFQDGVDRT